MVFRSTKALNYRRGKHQILSQKKTDSRICICRLILFGGVVLCFMLLKIITNKDTEDFGSDKFEKLLEYPDNGFEEKVSLNGIMSVSDMEEVKSTSSTELYGDNASTNIQIDDSENNEEGNMLVSKGNDEEVSDVSISTIETELCSSNPYAKYLGDSLEVISSRAVEWLNSNIEDKLKVKTSILQGEDSTYSKETKAIENPLKMDSFNYTTVFKKDTNTDIKYHVDEKRSETERRLAEITEISHLKSFSKKINMTTIISKDNKDIYQDREDYIGKNILSGEQNYLRKGEKLKKQEKNKKNKKVQNSMDEYSQVQMNKGDSGKKILHEVEKKTLVTSSISLEEKEFVTSSCSSNGEIRSSIPGVCGISQNSEAKNSEPCVVYVIMVGKESYEKEQDNDLIFIRFLKETNCDVRVVSLCAEAVKDEISTLNIETILQENQSYIDNKRLVVINDACLDFSIILASEKTEKNDSNLGKDRNKLIINPNQVDIVYFLFPSANTMKENKHSFSMTSFSDFIGENKELFLSSTSNRREGTKIKLPMQVVFNQALRDSLTRENMLKKMIQSGYISVAEDNEAKTVTFIRFSCSDEKKNLITGGAARMTGFYPG